MIKSILLPVDGSSYTDAVLTYGQYLAEKFEALLRVITVLDIRTYEWTMNVGSEGYMPVIPANVYYDESHKFLQERADTLVKKVKEKFVKDGISCECERFDGSPVDTICELSRQVDLVIMGARGDYARWGNTLLGATVESFSRQCQIPLMIVDNSFKPFKALIAAYDKSEYSNRALKWAAFICSGLDLPLEVLTVQNDEVLRKECLDEARNYLKPFNLDIRYRHEAGDAEKMLIEASHAVTDSTLLVMGSYGHSRIREAILGSTTEQVMRKAAKPILLVK